MRRGGRFDHSHCRSIGIRREFYRHCNRCSNRSDIGIVRDAIVIAIRAAVGGVIDPIWLKNFGAIGRLGTIAIDGIDAIRWQSGVGDLITGS